MVEPATERENPTVIDGLTDADIASLEKKSAAALMAYLDSNDERLAKRATVAQATLSAMQRRRATDGARDALHFAMARSLTSDPAQLSEYIRVTQPHSPIVRALPSGHGSASPGKAGNGTAQQGDDSNANAAGLGPARPGLARSGAAQQGDRSDAGEARRGTARPSGTSPGVAEQGEAE